MRTKQRLDGACSGGLVRGARHSAYHHWHGRLNRALRRRWIDTQLLADLLDLLRAQMLLYEVDDAHSLMAPSGDANITARMRPGVAIRASNRYTVQLVHSKTVDRAGSSSCDSITRRTRPTWRA